MKINNYIKFNQKNITTYMFTMDAEMLIYETTVDYFEDGVSENNGYQRPLSEVHYKNIAKYLLNDKQSMLPTAIIGAIGGDSIIVSDEMEIADKVRIVDGQHRREALKYIKNTNKASYEQNIKNIKFPVLLMEINKEDLNEFIVEVQTFVNINKKGRKVSTDLALSLEEIISTKILQNEGFTNKTLAITLIAKNIIYKFNRDKKSCWFEKIKTGDMYDKGRPISKNAFYNSIEAVIDKFIDENYCVDTYNSRLIDDVTDKLYVALKNIWQNIAEKWPECFYWDNSEKWAEYDKDYSIQKGIGVYPIHGLISELNLDQDLNGLDVFNMFINNSKITSEDWARGSTFSGFNSASGFKKIIKAIKDNEFYETLKYSEE